MYSYVYEIRHTVRAGLFNALFTGFMLGKVAQCLRQWAVNHDAVGSNPAFLSFYFC